MPDKDKTKEVAKVAPPQLPAIPDLKKLKEVFESNFEGITPSFEVIKIPTGGNLFWMVPTEEGEDSQKELVGVILDHYTVRAFWLGAYSGGNSPPTCSSFDGRQGSLPRNQDGEFGECGSHLKDSDPHKCKWAKFGTAVKPDGSPGRGQACKLKHRVYLLPLGKSYFPYLIPLSVMSATKKYEGSISTYVVKLGGQLKKLCDVKTRVKLIGDTNSDGLDYSKAQFFEISGGLTKEEKEMTTFLGTQLKSAMRSRPFEAEEFDTEEKGGQTRGTEQREADGGGRGGEKDSWDKKRGDDIPF